MTNSDRVKWIKLLWIQRAQPVQGEHNCLSFYVWLCKSNPKLLRFNNFKGDSYQKIVSILENFHEGAS